MSRTTIALLALLALSSQAMAERTRKPFQEPVPRMELRKFLGSWYVIGVSPTIFEKGAANGIETYSLDEEGRLRVEYVFFKGGPEGARKVMRQKAWILDEERNTEWKVQPLWPFKLPYLIIDLAEDYRYAAVGTNNCKYVWIMSRTPLMAEEDYAGILSRLAERGYDIRRIERMRQVW